MLSHAHAFRHGFALPKAAASAMRLLRSQTTGSKAKPAASLDPRLRADLGLDGDELAKPSRPHR